MKKLVLATVLASLTGLALADVSATGVSASLTYDEKDKQNSTQVNYVYGLNVGIKLGNGWSTEARMEDERVETGSAQKQESLAQVKVNYDIATSTPFTPYVAAAVGHKNKATIDFNFWVAEAGVKAKFGDFGVRYGYRRRADWEQSTTNAYNTDEQTIAFGYDVTKNDTLSVAWKQERANDSVSSEYNTKGIYYTRRF